MLYKNSSPAQKTVITSPRKVTHIHNNSPDALKHQTKITTSKKIIIQTNYQPLQSNTYRDRIQYTKSTYIPSQEIASLDRVNSQLRYGNSKIVINQISNKENDINFIRKNTQNSSSNIQRVSAIRKLNIPNLFTTLQDIYEGEYNQKRLFHGRGTYYFRGCNVKYEGEFQDGEIHGFGKLIYQTPFNQFPIIYEGNFRYAKKYGKGKYYYGDKKHFYEGQWINDLKEGHGLYESPDQIYQGFWAKSKKHGQGCLINKRNNTEFRGKFYDDFFTQGTIKYSNGDVYVGSFHLGKKQGFGTYIYKLRNEQYKGQFSNDLRHGKGTLKISNGDQFTGNFRHGRIDESMNCSYRWSNGSVFNGWFKNGQPDKGTIKNYKEEKQYQYTSTASFIHY